MLQLLPKKLTSPLLQAGLLLAWFCHAFAMAGYGQISPGQSSGTDAQYSLSGSVINSVTGEPIRRALVQIYGGGENVTLTDSEGHFEFSGLPAMQTAISARKPGFFNEREASQLPGTRANIRIQVGPDTAPVILKLVPESVIFGRVAGDGDPLENLPVKVVRAKIADGRKIWEQAGNAATDADGEFRITGLVPGTYYAVFGPAQVGTAPIRSQSKTRGRGYAQSFFPGAPEITASAPIEVGGGQQFEADMSLKAEPLYLVSGLVTGNAGDQGPRGANVELLTPSGDNLPLPVEFDPKTGQFKTQVPAGAYLLRAQTFGEGLSLIANLPLTVSSDAPGLRLAMEPETTIPVTVKMESSGSAVGKSGTQGGVRSGPPVTVRLTSSGFSLAPSEFWSDLEGAGSQAALAIRNVEPGRYWAEITPNGAWYVQAAQSGGVDLLRDDLIVATGAHSPPIEVVLRDDGATLAGTVTSDGQPAQGFVLAIPDRSPRQAKMLPANQQGRFQSGVLPPGDYSVLAFDQLAVDQTDRIEYTNPEALAPYMNKASHLTLAPNQRADLSGLDLIRVER
jgi:hypothetical protein